MKLEQENLVLIYVKLPVLVNVDQSKIGGRLGMEVSNFKIVEDDLHLLFKQCGDYCVKLGAGAILADCKPCAILSLITFCQKNKFAFVIAPLGIHPLTLSRDYQDLTEWMKHMGQEFRLTEFPAQQ